MTKVTIAGFLIEDAKIHMLDNSDKIANICISARTEDPKKKKASPPERQLWNVSIYLSPENKLADHLKKGTNVVVDGRMYTEIYKEQTYVRVNANPADVEMTSGKKPDAPAAAGKPQAQGDQENDWGGKANG